MALTTYRVLVCEDDPAMVRIFQFLLQKNGIGPVMTVSEGTKVVPMVLREKPQLILLDLMLPGKDGLSILKELKKNEVSCSIPVIVVSGIESQNQVSHAIDAGAADYVTKPFDSMELGKRLHQFLSSMYNTPSPGPGTPPPPIASGGSF